MPCLVRVDDCLHCFQPLRRVLCAKPCHQILSWKHTRTTRRLRHGGIIRSDVTRRETLRSGILSGIASCVYKHYERHQYGQKHGRRQRHDGWSTEKSGGWSVEKSGGQAIDDSLDSTHANSSLDDLGPLWNAPETARGHANRERVVYF